MYKYAIVRKPGKNFAEGITTQKLGKPDYNRALEQHKKYCEALKKCGLKLAILEPSLNHPDCPFVEDTAIISEKFAVITLIGDESRRGEEKEIIKVLSEYHRNPTTLGYTSLHPEFARLRSGQIFRTLRNLQSKFLGHKKCNAFFSVPKIENSINEEKHTLDSTLLQPEFSIFVHKEIYY